MRWRLTWVVRVTLRGKEVVFIIKKFSLGSTIHGQTRSILLTSRHYVIRHLLIENNLVALGIIVKPLKSYLWFPLSKLIWDYGCDSCSPHVFTKNPKNKSRIFTIILIYHSPDRVQGRRRAKNLGLPFCARINWPVKIWDCHGLCQRW